MSLTLAAGGLLYLLIRSDHGLGPLWIVLTLAGLAAVAERGSIRLSSTVEVSVSALPTLFAAVAVGPIATMVVSACSLLGDFRSPYMKWATQTSARAVNGALTGLAAAAAAELSHNSVGSIAVATVVSVVVNQSLDLAFAALTVGIRRSGDPWTVIQTFLPVMPSSIVLWVAVVAPLAVVYTDLSPWAVLLFLFPALAAQRLFAMYQEQRRLADDLAVANQSLESANLSFASALVATLDARDRYTAGHSAAVAIYSRDIAAKLDLPQDVRQLAHLSGLLHDIGKIGVPPGILEKNGPLTISERRKMEEHSITGERILAKVEAYGEIARIVRHHHERIDGQGYPDGLRNDDIPMISRIICVADAYNAMTSDRPYRDAMSIEVAREQLVAAAGTQFDSAIAFAFDSILESASETYSSGIRADFALEAQAHPGLTADVAVNAA